MKKITKVLSALVFVFLITLNINASFSNNPVGDIPVGKAKLGYVKVVIENKTDNTLTPYNEIVNTKVDLYESDSMLNVIVRATNQKKKVVGLLFSDTYISSVDGLEGTYPAGWITFLNDWTTNLGATSFTTESSNIFASGGDLRSGDVISVEYTKDGGVDLNSFSDNNNKNLKNISFSAGQINKEFKPSTFDYELKVKSSVKSLSIIPSAVNRNFMCRIFVDKKEYSRNELVKIKENDIVKVICGEPEWLSMNNGEFGSGAEDVPASTYTFKVKYSDKQIVDSDNKLPTTGQDLTYLYITLALLASSSVVYFTFKRN